MTRFWTALIASAITVPTFAQSGVLYAPARTVKDQNIALRSWGSGTISETDELAYQGTHSLRVSTRNYFQGGLVAFGTPINLTNDYADKNNLLRMTFKVADASLTLGGPSGGPGGAGRPGGGGPSSGGGLAGAGAAGGGTGGGPGRGAGGGTTGGGGGRGGAGGRGGPGGLGGLGGGQGRGGGEVGGAAGQPGGSQGPGAGAGGATATRAPLRNLRFIVSTTDGKKSEVYVPISTGSGKTDWQSVAIPLQSILGFDRTNKEIKEIGLAGDATSTFYVGELKIVNDTTPITGDVNVRELNLALGDEVTLAAAGYGGSTILKYSWDFDDKDGIQVDAEGQAVKHRFRKPGTYNVTMTVSDTYGLKKPYSTTIKVTVNP